MFFLCVTTIKTATAIEYIRYAYSLFPKMKILTKGNITEEIIDPRDT